MAVLPLGQKSSKVFKCKIEFEPFYTAVIFQVLSSAKQGSSVHKRLLQLHLSHFYSLARRKMINVERFTTLRQDFLLLFTFCLSFVWPIPVRLYQAKDEKRVENVYCYSKRRKLVTGMCWSYHIFIT